MIPGTARAAGGAPHVEFGDGVVLPLPRGRARRRRPARCSTACGPSIARSAARGLPVAGRRRRADRRRHAALLPLQRPGSHGDDRRSRRLPPGRPHQPRARSAARASVRRGERLAARGVSCQTANGSIARSPQPKEECMSDIKRRDFLKATAGVAAGTALGGGSALFAAEAAAQQYKITPEKGAKLRVLRWKRFVQGDEDVWAANTKKFTADDGHRSARRRRRLGRRAAQGGGRRQRRQRSRHHHQHDGGRAPVSRQARRRIGSSPTTSATSTAAGTRRPRPTACTTRSGSRS